MSPNWQYYVYAIVAALVVRSIFAVLRTYLPRRHPPVIVDLPVDELILRPSKALIWVWGAFAMLAPLGVVVTFFTWPCTGTNEVLVRAGLAVFLALLFGLASLRAGRRCTRMDDHGLTSEYVFAKPGFFPWEDVVKVTRLGSHEFLLHGRDGGKALLDSWFVGAGSAMSMLKRHLPKEVRKKYKSTLAQFAASVDEMSGIRSRPGSQQS
jgi:hypothetical protein